MKPSVDDDHGSVERKRLAARDRALAYVKALNLPVEDGLELVLDCLKRAGAGADLPGLMAELDHRLGKTGWSPEKMIQTPAGGLQVTPRLQRTAMISEGLDISCFHMLGRILTGGFRPAAKAEDAAASEAGPSGNKENKGHE